MREIGFHPPRLVGAVLGAAVAMGAGVLIGYRYAPTPPPPPVLPSATPGDPSARFVATADAAARSVVHVKIFVQDNWGGARDGGLGSGVIVGPTTVLTNHHVVRPVDQAERPVPVKRIEVHLYDGRKVDARVKGADPDTDLAVLELTDAKDLPVAVLGDSDALCVGQWLLAIGNPFGIGRTVTAGIVSARGRTGVGINHAEDFVQTDAAINPGNSGGPLVDLDGKVVGICSAIIGKNGRFQGIGLAIPINIAKSIIKSLDETGQIYRGYIGIHIETVEFTEGPRAGQQAVRVARVEPDSPAAQAGLLPLDVIVSYGGQPVHGHQHLLGRIAAGDPGQQVALEILRGRETRVVHVTLGKRAISG